MNNPILNIKNFRSFGETNANFELAPITVLTGCNSAGKSSTVKAQLLLKGLMEIINQRVEKLLNKGTKLFNISLRQILSELVLHISDKELQLGRYDRAINDQSTSGKLSFSYTIFSEPLLQNITVEMTFIGQENEVVNDAVLHHVCIKTGGMTVLDLDNLENKYNDSFISPTNEKINYISILSSFRKFMVYCVKAQSLKDEDDYNLYISDLSKEDIEKQLEIAERWVLQMGLEKDDINVYRNIKGILNFSPSFSSINDYLNKGSIYSWLPIFEQADNMTKQQVRSWMLEKATAVSSEKNNQPIQWVNYFCDDFESSNCASLTDYFLSLENDSLSKGDIDSPHTSIPIISVVLSDASVLFDNDGSLIRPKGVNKDNFFDRQVYDDNKSFYEILNSLQYIFLGPDSINPTITMGETNRFIKNDMVRSLRSYAREVVLSALNPVFLSNIKYVNSSSTIVRRLYVLDENDKIGRSINQFVNGEKQNFIEIDRTKESLLFENEKLKYIPGTFMKTWCKELEIGNVSIEGTEQGLGAVVYVEKDGRKRLMAEEGYGITQLFTLILQLECCILNATRRQVVTGEWSLYSDSYIVDYEPQCVCVEEPEIHLHPKYQSLLADMFVEAYKKYNIHFVIETHSEYLIRKLQLMVADKDISLTSNEISLNYVEKHENGISTNRKIEILEDGRLSEPFGPGFFDESKSLVMQMMKF